MTPYKRRTKSTELLILSLLYSRLMLSTKDKHYFINLQKGYEGEVEFDAWTKQLQCDCLILNDLLIHSNNTVFQVDSLIISSEVIYLFEVKNYEGDYYYEGENFYKKPMHEILNPLHQLGRCESLLRQLLRKHGFSIPIKSYVIFINPEFTLYQAPLDKPIIYPTQIPQFMKKLNSISTKLTDRHKQLAKRLVKLHMNESPYNKLPSYDYTQMTKGIMCLECQSFAISIVGRKCVCNDCGNKETAATAVMRAVKEFQLLFPEKKITSSIIHEWCKVVPFQKMIRNILNQHFVKVSDKRWTYYK
ncbi:nuclease-related domain-containing protein [Oceanobacillus halotolerans]|uniref:nuclease-related domain-containing protein n=1 Tax=Oceanobacillus halotolerans TaxID=2663380 RepID=UPI0013DC4DE4|nr:nuclease-related domain-containing protein [Oceanobacillus halotolerans]